MQIVTRRQSHSRPVRATLPLILVTLMTLVLDACATGPSGTGNIRPTPSPTIDLTCTSRDPVTAPLLGTVGKQTTLALPGAPFASLASPDGQWLFVTLDVPATRGTGTGGNGTSGLAVLRRTGTQSATLAHIFPVPPNPFGLALSPDSHLLAVADYSSVLFFDVALAEAGNQHAEVGQLDTSSSASTIEVQFSADGRYVFATNEGAASVSLFDLLATGTRGFGAADAVGEIAVGPDPVGMALSPDGTRLYVASRFSAEGAQVWGTQSNSRAGGALTVIDVNQAERSPGHAVAGEALTGCGPVRVVLSPDGTVAWITVQGSNTVQAFATGRILSDPRRALLATVTVGPSPTALLLINSGRFALVTDSDRFARQQTPQTISVVDTQRALAGQPALVGDLPAGIFPRDLTQTGDTIVLANFGSDAISLLNATQLP